MSEHTTQELPRRLFQLNCEPEGRVNKYFNLRAVEHIKQALEQHHLNLLMNSQFNLVMQMENHEFSVVFVHYLLSRQLVTNKQNELWWLFAGKPIRYGLKEFAIVTGLNCKDEDKDDSRRRLKKAKKGKADAKDSVESVWNKLFEGEKKPTTTWIHKKLVQGKKYKDPETRFKLALLLLVDGILCPISNNTLITKERVEQLLDIDEFLKYPWGRKSFYLTVQSTKSKSPFRYTKPTTTIQGFSHAMILVTVACCPPILENAVIKSMMERNATIHDIVAFISSMSLHLQNKTFRSLNQIGVVSVISLLSDASPDLVAEIELDDDKDDHDVDYLLMLISEDHPFEINSWAGGIRAVDVLDVLDEHPSNAIVGTSTASHRGGTRSAPTTAINEDLQEQIMPILEGYTRSAIDQVVAKLYEDVEKRLKQGNSGKKDDFALAAFHETEKQTNEIGDNTDARDEDTIPINSPNRFEENIFRTRDPADDIIANVVSEHGANVQYHGVQGHEPIKIDESALLMSDSTNKMEIETLTAQHNQLPTSSKTVGLGNVSTTVRGEVTAKEVKKVPTCGDYNDHVEEDTFATMTNEREDAKIEPPKGHNKYKGKDTLQTTHTKKAKVAKPQGSPPNVVRRTSGGVKGIPDTRKRKAVVLDTVEEDDPFHVIISPLILDFKAFDEPVKTKCELFQNFIQNARFYDLGDNLQVENTVFLQLFKPVEFWQPNVVDIVVRYIQKRRDQIPNCQFDFLPTSWVLEMKRLWSSFHNTLDKDKFPFSRKSRMPIARRPNWYSSIHYVYCAIPIQSRHWVGLVIDFDQRSIEVLDCNNKILTNEQVQHEIMFLSIILPYFIKRHGVALACREISLEAFEVHRKELEILVEDEVLAGVATVVLMEQHALDRIDECCFLEKRYLKVAAMNYGIESFNSVVPIQLDP